LTVSNSGRASATSSTIITGEPNEFVREIQTRMPVILPKDITILGYLVKQEKRFWSGFRQIE
jgi:hypothetical protein